MKIAGWSACRLLLPILVAALLVPTPAHAADAGTADFQWKKLSTPMFEHIDVDQGLPHPVVMALAQDGDGFIWAGTQGGLARWDGYHMRTFKFDAKVPASLPGNFIQTLHTDVKGRLWVGTSFAGLAMYERRQEHFVRYVAGPSGISHNSVTALASDLRGGIWVGTADGLDYLDPASGVISHFKHDTGLAGSLPDNRIRALCIDKLGNLWIGTVSGLVMHVPGSKRFARVPVAGGAAGAMHDAVLALHQDSGGNIAFGTLKSGIGVVAAGATSGRVVTGPASEQLRANMILSIAELIPGHWWVASYGGGVFDYEPATGKLHAIRHDPLVASSLGHDRTAALLRDRSGMMWISTERSLDRHNPAGAAVHTVFGGVGLPEANVTAMMQARNGRLWVAMADQGIDIIEQDGTRLSALRPDPEQPATSLPRRVAFALAQGDQGQVWIGTHLGLYQTDQDARRVARVALPVPNPYPRISRILPEGKVLWLSTGEGLMRYDTGSGLLKHYVQGPAAAGGLTDSRVELTLAAPDGQLWIGTRNGLNRLDTKSGAIEHISFGASGLPHGLAEALALDHQGRLWIGTYGGGLCVLLGRDASGKPLLRTLAMAQGLSNENISSLQVDQRGRIWAGSADGINLIDPDTFAIRAMGRADGLAIRNYDTGAVLSNGEMLFGGTGGLAAIDPERLGQWGYRAPLVLSAVRLGSRSLAAASLGSGAGAGPLVVPPHTSGFEIEFSALDYSAPQRNRFAYRLDGYDRGWTPADATRRVAAYTNLPPGSYLLQVRGSNRDGVWTEPPLTLPIDVLPAWYQTWWTKGASVVMVLLLGWGVVRWRVRALEQERTRLEARVLSRTLHLEKLNAIVKSVNEQLDFDRLLEAVLEQSTVIEGVDAAYALVRAHDAPSEAGKAAPKDTDTFSVRASWDREGAPEARASISLDQAEQRYGLSANMVSPDIFLMHHVGAGALIALRIEVEERIEGYLVFENRSKRDAFDQGDLDLLTGLKEHFVSAFQKARALRMLDQARTLAEAATRAKSAFLANISHEIRTPMNAILGFAGLGARLDLQPKPLDYFGKIGRAGQNLLSIINDLLDFSKIEAGMLELESLPFELSDVLDQVGDLFAWRATEKNLELLIWAAPDVPPALVGDPQRLGQVLINLIGNALKFTASGFVQLSVELDAGAPALRDNVRLRFKVEDSGIGISDEQHIRLFQAFSQADSSTTRLYGGTGLGLAISQELVRCQGGAIEVVSTPGMGSCFSFTAQFACQAKQGQRVLQAPPGARGKRVLVVDDSAQSRALLEHQLHSFGFAVALADSGTAAIHMLQQEPFDLVLMDWDMPDMDGIAATVHIRTDPTLASLPAVVMVTAYGREELMKAAQRAGIQDYLIKPVNPELLLSTVVSALAGDGASAHALPVPSRAPAAPSPEALRIRGMRVLVVDDNIINQQVASEILEGAGVVVELASSGIDAVEMVDRQRYDAVLLDIQMPEMDGYQATARIRQQARHTDLPIIAMTAHAVTSYRESCLAMGMNDYVTKPIEPEQMFAALASWTRHEQVRPDPSAPAPADVAVIDAALVDLPGVDVASALARFGGSMRLLVKLLGVFDKEYGQTAVQLRAAMDCGDLDAAQRLAHMIRGTAGNLSASTLFSAAVALEEALTNRNASALPGKLEAFYLAFDQVQGTARASLGKALAR